MLIQSITDLPRDGYPLHVTAKRYWIPEFEANASDPDALTLVLLHSTSFHKETWEPTLEQVFRLAAETGSTVKIREAWSLDCPNHGESVRLNEKELAQPGFQNNCTVDPRCCLDNTLTAPMRLKQLHARNMPKPHITFFLLDPTEGHKSISGEEDLLGLGIRLEEMQCMYRTNI